tara:strand:- start:37 stop:255 length:219 start_codon:yes stop_codon:yes gene_type:complete
MCVTFDIRPSFLCPVAPVFVVVVLGQTQCRLEIKRHIGTDPPAPLEPVTVQQVAATWWGVSLLLEVGAIQSP